MEPLKPVHLEDGGRGATVWTDEVTGSDKSTYTVRLRRRSRGLA